MMLRRNRTRSDPVIEFDPRACYRAVSGFAVFMSIAARDILRLEVGPATSYSIKNDRIG